MELNEVFCNEEPKCLELMEKIFEAASQLIEDELEKRVHQMLTNKEKLSDEFLGFDSEVIQNLTEF